MTQETQRARGAAPGTPTRNALCHCGSGLKYKRCCGSASGQSKAPGSLGSLSDPRAVQQQFLRGVQMLQSGQTLAAISILHAAILSDENHFDAHHALGSAFAQNGQFPEASAVLSRAVALRPNSAAANHDLAAAYDFQGLHEQAIEAYKKVVELKPKLGEVHHRLGELYVTYSRTEEAAACFDRAAEINRNTAAARLFRSDAQLLRGDIAGAEEWARKAVALEAANSAAQGTLAGLLYAQGRFEEAATHFETALRLNPKMAKCWDGLAHCGNIPNRTTRFSIACAPSCGVPICTMPSE